MIKHNEFRLAPRPGQYFKMNAKYENVLDSNFQNELNSRKVAQLL